METLYQFTIFVDLTLLAIVTAIFIFAISIYKGASELRIKEETDTSNKRKELIAKRKSELTQKIQTAPLDSLRKTLQEELDTLDNLLRDIDKPVSKIIKNARVLTAKYLVFFPGVFLLLSIIASGIAGVISDPFQNVLWVFSLFLSVLSLYFIYRNIRSIDYFSSFIDFSTFMERALERHTQKVAPVIDVLRWNYQLEMNTGETKEIKYLVYLKKGLIGQHARIRITGSEELDFPDETNILRFGFNYQNMKNPKHFWHTLGDINPKSLINDKYKVKAPTQPGEYVMAYWLQCDGFSADEKYFTVRVK